MEARWKMPCAKCEIPRYDAFDDPYCPWGMAAVVDEQRRRRPKRILLPPTRPTVADIPRSVSNVTYQKGACDLELTKLALARNQALSIAAEVRRGRRFDESEEKCIERLSSLTSRVAFGLEARRFLDKRAPPFIFAGEPYVLTMLRDVSEHLGFDRNPLMLPRPHPAFQKIDAEISTLKKGQIHPHYGIKSDAEYAIIKELRAMPADCVPEVPAHEARRRVLRHSFESTEDMLKATEAKLVLIRKAIAETPDVAFKDACKLARLKRKEEQLEARRRALNKLVYADRQRHIEKFRRKSSSRDNSGPSKSRLDEKKDEGTRLDDQNTVPPPRHDQNKATTSMQQCHVGGEEQHGVITTDDTTTFASFSSYASGPEMWVAEEGDSASRYDKVSQKRRQAAIFLQSYCRRVAAKRALTIFATRAAALVELRRRAASEC